MRRPICSTGSIPHSLTHSHSEKTQNLFESAAGAGYADSFQSGFDFAKSVESLACLIF